MPRPLASSIYLASGTQRGLPTLAWMPATVASETSYHSQLFLGDMPIVQLDVLGCILYNNFVSMKTSADEFHSRVAQLNPFPDNGLCVCCQEPLLKPSLIVADAPQAYEVIDCDKALDDFRLIAEITSRDPLPKVQVWSHRNHRTSKCLMFQRYMSDRIIFKPFTLLRCLEAYVNMRIY